MKTVGHMNVFILKHGRTASLTRLFAVISHHKTILQSMSGKRPESWSGRQGSHLDCHLSNWIELSLLYSHLAAGLTEMAVVLRQAWVASEFM